MDRFTALKPLESRPRLQNNFHTIIIIPEINFTCNGTIVEVTVAGMQQNNKKNPKIQIWREEANTTGDGLYYKSGAEIVLEKAACIDYQNRKCRNGSKTTSIFECKLYNNRHVSVQPGDILGLELPNKWSDKFEIYFTTPGPNNYIFLGKNRIVDNLVSANITKPQQPQICLQVVPDSDPGLYKHIILCTRLAIVS